MFFSCAWFCPCLLCSKEKQLKRKEAKAEVAAQLETAIEKELLARLQVRLAGCFKSWRGLGKAACQLACPSLHVSNRTLSRLMHLPCWPAPQSGTYGDIYNFPQRQYEKALAQEEVVDADAEAAEEDQIEAEAEMEEVRSCLGSVVARIWPDSRSSIAAVAGSTKPTQLLQQQHSNGSSSAAGWEALGSRCGINAAGAVEWLAADDRWPAPNCDPDMASRSATSSWLLQEVEEYVEGDEDEDEDEEEDEVS